MDTAFKQLFESEKWNHSSDFESCKKNYHFNDLWDDIPTETTDDTNNTIQTNNNRNNTNEITTKAAQSRNTAQLNTGALQKADSDQNAPNK